MWSSFRICQSFSPQQTAVVNLKSFRMQKKESRKIRYTATILLYFLDLMWLVRWLECVVMGMGGAWGEEEDHIEERSNCQSLGPQESGAKELDSWPMGYLTEGRRSNSHTKILLMSLPMAMHQVVLSQSRTKNIPTISLHWMPSENFLLFFYVFKKSANE